MILPPPNWHERHTSDVLMYVPREPPLDCVLTYAERVVPLRSLAAHVRETLATDPEFEVDEVFMINRFITLEGELGGRVTVKGHRRDEAVTYIVAAIMAEEFSTRLTCRVVGDRVATYEQLVHELAMNDQLALGVRRRRIPFYPPLDWHLVPQMGLEVAFYPPDYPRSHACIVVPPADPITPTNHPKQVLEERDTRRGIPPAAHTTLDPIDTRSASLVGELWTTRHPLEGTGELLRYLAVLKDDTFYYALRLEALAHESRPEYRELLVDTAGTVEPLPTRATPRDVEATPLFEMWSG